MDDPKSRFLQQRKRRQGFKDWPKCKADVQVLELVLTVLEQVTRYATLTSFEPANRAQEQPQCILLPPDLSLLLLNLNPEHFQ